MTRRILSIIFFAVIGTVSLFAQDFDEDDENIDWSERLIEEVKLENPVYKPILGVGIGTLNFYGDVKNTYLSDPMGGNQSFNVDILRTMDPRFTFGFRFMYGQLSANDYEKKLNFKSQIMTFGANLTYNFSNFKYFDEEQQKRVINPYITLGIEFLNYDTQGDMKSKSGEFLYYWNDGTVRDVPQDDYYVGNSRVLLRDYDYETSYKEINNKYKIEESNNSQISIGIPIDFGIQMTMSQKVSMKVGYSHHLTFVDDIDDITEKSEGADMFNRDRTGKSGPDQFGYTYISLALDLFSRTTEERQLQFLDLGAGGIFDFWDVDGDFVMDIYDQCPFTPFGQLVDTAGCPLDDDIDKVPNYKDQEENTPQNAFYVDTIGKEVKESELLTQLNDNESLEQPVIYDHYPSLLDGTGLYRRFYKKIPEKFKSLDEDEDDYISLDELINSIDTFFEGNSELTVDDLYELNEFFFIQ